MKFSLLRIYDDDSTVGLFMETYPDAIEAVEYDELWELDTYEVVLELLAEHYNDV